MTTRTYRAVAAAAGIAIGAGALVALARHASSASTAAAHDATQAAQLANVESRMSELEAAVANHRDRIDSGQAASHAANAAAPAQSTEPPRARPGPSAPSPRTPPTPDELRDLEVQRMRSFDDAITNEPRDTAWAPPFENALREAARSFDGTASVDSVSCRTSLCRMEVSAGSRESADGFLAALRGHLPQMTGAHWSIDLADDGSTKTTVDIVRQGYAMPAPPE